MSTVLLPSGRCLHHDPDRADDLRLIRKAGGHAVADVKRLARKIKDTAAPANLPSVEPDSLDHLARWHRWVVRAAATGEISADVARTITGSLKEIRAVQIAAGMERRVRDLERRLRDARGAR